ncbi:MAG: sialidase family protein [Actinomycetota bacterium]
MRNGRRRVLAVGAVLTAIVVAVGLTAQAGGSSRPSGGRGLATRDGKKVSVAKLPVAQTFSVGNHAAEPTLGLDPAGNIYYAAAGFSDVGLSSTEIMRSKDRGKTWDVASPRTLGQNQMPVTLDPYIYVDDNIDGDNARIFTIDLTLACSYLSFSDDGGESWITNPLACGRPVNDHQTLFSGPPVSSPTVNYPNVLYYCFNDVASSSCTKSLDGGLTFIPTGSPAYRGYEPGNENPGFVGADGFCGGLHGHGAVGPDGAVYLPREYCGSPQLAISKDEGLTWETVVVSKKIRSTSQPKGGTGHPSVAVDAKGNVYYLWVSDKNRLPYLSVSKDQGKTWSDPVIASIPGLKETNLPQIDVRGVGKIAFVYYGSTNSPYPKCKLECKIPDYKDTRWNAYIAASADALSANPTFYTGTVNDPKDPLVLGRCGPGRCQDVFDFIDVEIGPDGIAYGAFVDGCMDVCPEGLPSEGYEGLMSKLVGAPLLR